MENALWWNKTDAVHCWNTPYMYLHHNEYRPSSWLDQLHLSIFVQKVTKYFYVVGPIPMMQLPKIWFSYIEVVPPQTWTVYIGAEYGVFEQQMVSVLLERFSACGTVIYYTPAWRICGPHITYTPGGIKYGPMNNHSLLQKRRCEKLTNLWPVAPRRTPTGTLGTELHQSRSYGRLCLSTIVCSHMSPATNCLAMPYTPPLCSARCGSVVQPARAWLWAILYSDLSNNSYTNDLAQR